MLTSFFSTIALTLSIGGFLVGLRAALRLNRVFMTDLALTALGGLLILAVHAWRADLQGLDPFLDLPLVLAKDAIELIVVLMVLVAT